MGLCGGRLDCHRVLEPNCLAVIVAVRCGRLGSAFQRSCRVCPVGIVRGSFCSGSASSNGQKMTCKWQKPGSGSRRDWRCCSRDEANICFESGGRTRLRALSAQPRQSRCRSPHQTTLRFTGSGDALARNRFWRRTDHQARHQPGEYHLPGLQRPNGHQRAVGPGNPGRTARAATRSLSKSGSGLPQSKTLSRRRTPFRGSSSQCMRENERRLSRIRISRHRSIRKQRGRENPWDGSSARFGACNRGSRRPRRGSPRPGLNRPNRSFLLSLFSARAGLD